MWMITATAQPIIAAIVAAALARVTADLFNSPVLAFIAGCLAGLIGYFALLIPWLRQTLRSLKALYGRDRGQNRDRRLSKRGVLATPGQASVAVMERAT
jgi:hypothetical protein